MVSILPGKDGKDGKGRGFKDGKRHLDLIPFIPSILAEKQKAIEPGYRG